MKKMKLLTFALAALFAGNAMAADYTPTGVYKVGDETTLGTKWSDKGQPANFYVSGDTVIFSPFLCYQSAGADKQEWTGCVGSGSTSATWVGQMCFKGSTVWGTGDASKKCSTIRSTRTAYYNVTNCQSILALADLRGSGREMYIKAFEIVDGIVATEAAKIVTRAEDGIGVLILDGLEASKTYQIIVSTNVDKNSNFYEVAFVAAPAATNIATLKAITIDGEALEGFSAATKEYNVELPFGTTEVPAVLATTTSAKANAVVTPAAALPGATTILVTAEDGETKETYTINFTVAASASDDATLAALMVDGKAIAGFRADSLDYAYEAAYSKNMPVVTATANDENAVVAITQITAFPGTATILVTAQAGNTLTYKIAFTQATAPKVLLEAVFSNGAKGAIKDAVISVPYLQGKEIPTIVSFKTADSTMTAAEIEGGIRVTGADNTTLDYSIRTVELAPLAFTTDVITFDSTETYIFDPYGFASDKGWKFAKNVEEASNRRVSEGRTRIYFALPAAKEVRLTSGTGGARAIKVYVNGIENTTVTKTAAKNEFITIALNATSDNLVAIESDQTGGDGGFIQLQLVSNADTALENAAEAIVVEKTIIDGQLVIIKNGLMYNAQGIRLN